MGRRSVDGITVGFVILWLFIILVNVAWIGALIWGLITLVNWLVTK